MAQSDDVVLTILKNIQERLSGFEKRTDANLADVKESVVDLGEKSENMLNLMRYHLGITTTHEHQMEELGKQFKEMQKRLTAFEDARS